MKDKGDKYKFWRFLFSPDLTNEIYLELDQKSSVQERELTLYTLI